MKRADNRIRVIAVNNYKVESRFDIYLEFSGQREWLMMHRHNGFLYRLLHDSISLSELRRLKGREQRQIQYLLKVIDEYLEDRAA